MSVSGKQPMDLLKQKCEFKWMKPCKNEAIGLQTSHINVRL